MSSQQPTAPLSSIVQGRNPRTYFDPIEMADMEASVKANGVIQPILVRPFEGKLQIVAGERRYRAALNIFGETYEIPYLLKEMTDAEADELALVENIQRADMSPTEEAVAAAKILARYKGDREEAASRLGWKRQKLDSRLALMNCSELVRIALNERKIQLGHAELLATTTREQQDKALEAIIKNQVPVASIKQMLGQVSKSMTGAIFDKN
ncbi:PRTRC system ParB family protein [Undibacterium arcticum]